MVKQEEMIENSSRMHSQEYEAHQQDRSLSIQAENEDSREKEADDA